MKKLLLLFIASALLLSGCQSYDGDINALNDRLDNLEKTQIASINQQISAINTSLKQFEDTQEELQDYIKSLQATAEDLEDEITSINSKIDDLPTTPDDDTTTAEILAQLEAVKAS